MTPGHYSVRSPRRKPRLRNIDGNFLSEFHVGDLRPDPGPTEYCSAHMGMAVMAHHAATVVRIHE